MSQLDLTPDAADPPELAWSDGGADDIGGQGVDVLEAPPVVDVETVRMLLQGASGVISEILLARLPPGQRHAARELGWGRLTPGELDALAPPITHYAQRNPAVARAVAHGDLVAMGAVGARVVARHLALAERLKHEQSREVAGPPDDLGGDGGPGGALRAFDGASPQDGGPGGGGDDRGRAVPKWGDR